MSYLLLLLYMGVVIYALTVWQWTKQLDISPLWISLFWILKVIAGFSLVYLYTHYYNAKNTSDIQIYFNDAYVFNKIAHRDFHLFIQLMSGFYDTQSETIKTAIASTHYWDTNDALYTIWGKRAVIRLNVLLSFISFHNIYIHSLWMSVLGFIGQIALYKFVKKQWHIHKTYLILSVFLLPTVLLWTSSILKEPIVFFAMGLMLYQLSKFLTSSYQFKHILYSILFGLLLWIIKPYLALVLIFPLFLLIVFTYYSQWSIARQFFVFCISILLLSAFFISLYTLHIFNIFDTIAHKQIAFFENVKEAQQTAVVGSFIDIPILKSNPISIFHNMPRALYNTAFKPFITDYNKFLYWPDILQNIFLLILILFFPFRFKKIQEKERAFFWFAITFVLMLFILVGLVTPVLGAIVRYKIPALIFLYLLLGHQRFVKVRF